MVQSNLDIFKIGVGPSSSHTLGPLLAALSFTKELGDNLSAVKRVQCTLYGSLALTGRGHLTDRAVIWGLSGLKPRNLDKAAQQLAVHKAFIEHHLMLGGKYELHFDYRQDLIFCKEFLKEHENALRLCAYDAEQNLLLDKTYFSVGGGFIKSAEDFAAEAEHGDNDDDDFEDKFKIENTKVALRLCEDDDLSLAELSLRYEKQFRSEEEIRKYCGEIWQVMQEVYAAGLNPSDDYLPGSLHLKRRAKALAETVSHEPSDDPLRILDQVSLYAISIAEENAAGARVVTAPTNGACAVIPAVMLYLKNNTPDFDDTKATDFLLAAMLIGSFYKNNASISGAEAGCQAEIGSASSMAAAAMVTVLDGNPFKACVAAEIAMEHHLGLTCDPVNGLVQIPCIERNVFGAIKAITAARMALARRSIPRVGLDEVIETMYVTGKDLSYKYKETALGGLAKLDLDRT